MNLVTKEKEGRVSIQFIYMLKNKVVAIATCPNHYEEVLSMVDGGRPTFCHINMPLWPMASP